jgi:uncharacterized protein YdaT
MPWTAQTFRARHNKRLGKKQAAKAARQANAILRETGDEGKAIRIANANARRRLVHAVMGRRPSNGSTN